MSLPVAATFRMRNRRGAGVSLEDGIGSARALDGQHTGYAGRPLGPSVLLSTAVSVYVPAFKVMVLACPLALAMLMAVIRQATSPFLHEKSAAWPGRAVAKA